MSTVPKRFRAKHDKVEAIQFNGMNAFDIWHFVGDQEAFNCPDLHATDSPMIETAEGIKICNLGDYVVRASDKNFFVCTEEAFKNNYEVIEKIGPLKL